VPDLVRMMPAGLYCPPGDFYIDPWRPVPRAFITHAHSDHARPGSKAYLTAAPGRGILQKRMGADAHIETLPYGKALRQGETTVSFHPAGHVLGSGQIRIEHHGEVWVVSGDYKTQPEKTCTPFEPVRCDVFFTESTFALPIYRWRTDADILADVHDWWRHNQTEGRTSVLLAYAFGKSQRLLSGLDASIGPIFVHGSVAAINEIYKQEGVTLAPTQESAEAKKNAGEGRALVVAPPSVQGTPWLRKFQPLSLAFASGWMQLRGARCPRSADRVWGRRRCAYSLNFSKNSTPLRGRRKKSRRCGVILWRRPRRMRPGRSPF
jgi:putative mRNA 3-end processing factor